MYVSLRASVIAATICSDSACFTRGSFAPWPMSNGTPMSSAEESGDRT